MLSMNFCWPMMREAMWSRTDLRSAGVMLWALLGVRLKVGEDGAVAPQ